MKKNPHHLTPSPSLPLPHRTDLRGPSICGIIVLLRKGHIVRSLFTTIERTARAFPCIATMSAGILFPASAALCAPEKGVRYADPQYGYTLTAPAGWTRKTDMPRPYVAFLGPEEEGFQTNFHVLPEPAAHKTLAQIVKQAKDASMQSKTVRYRDMKRATLAGTPAVMMESIVTLEGKPPSIARQIVAIHADRVYTITFAAAPAALKRNLPTFDKVLASFRWQPVKAGAAR